MKINKIRFENINSLRGSHFVDFTNEPLRSAGLFAITGPTGSGKTTLLDVICLALFGRVPRIAKSITKNVVAETGAILTRNTQACYAEVEYECKKGVFRSRWEISINRKGNLRDYEMFIANLADNKIIDAKKSEVPGINEGNIGLQFDQFVKSMLLAQGDFAKFLQSDKKERSALLEKITGTNIYRELGKRAFDKFKEHGQALEDLRKEQSVYKSQLLDDHLRAELTSAHAALQLSLSEMEKQLNGLRKNRDLLLEMDKLKAEQQKLKKKHSGLLNSKKEFEANEGEKIQHHEALIPYSDHLSQWKMAKEKIRESGREVLQLQGQIEEIHNKLEQTKSAVKQLVGVYYKHDNILASISAFQTKMNGLINEMKDLRVDYANAMGSLKPLKMHGVDFNSNDLEQSIKNYENLKINLATELAGLKKELAELEPAKMHEHLGLLDEKIELLKNAIPLQHRSDEQHQRLEKMSAEISSLDQNMEALPASILDAKQAWQGQQKVTENLSLRIENEKLKAELETHRKHLKAGEPCPLCGALEHPFADSQPAAPDALSQELSAEKERLNALQKVLIEKESELKQTESQLKNARANFETEQETLTRISAQLQDILQHFTDAEKDTGLQNLSTKIKDRRQRVHEYIIKDEKIIALKNAEADVEALQKAFAVGMLKRQEFQQLYPKKEEELPVEIQQIRDQWSQLNQQLEILNGNWQSKQAEQLALEKAQKTNAETLMAELGKLGYSSIENALQHRLSEMEFNQLLAARNALEQAINLNEQELKQNQKTLQEKGEQVSDKNLPELDAKIETLQAEKSNKSEEYAAIDRQLKNHEEDAAKVAQLQLKLIEAEKKGKQWVLLNQYIGDATGSKFNQFAQDLTLSQLIVLANRRLAGLNDRYLLDKATEKEDDSLMVVDQHMGNERRSVKTLSGGETFLMSLSLALALSDLASRNVEINSLFIDEGFGTLDPEVLDQTLDTLEKLQSEGNKTIGIISHVEALKERINTQIKLVRNGQGFSALEVQG